jgi:Ca2+-binding EF-hand superfamily protein
MRIQEKFGDYRRAFRFFDKDRDGTINFREFVAGLENLGIRLNFEEYRNIFNTLDND